MTAEKYKKVAMELLADYLDSEQSLIYEYSGDFRESAMELKEHVMEYLERLDEGEDTFNELVKDMLISDYCREESGAKDNGRGKS